MAEPKPSQPWDAVFDRLRVIYDAERNYPPPTTDDELGAVEEQLAFQFSLSYRTFATLFGLGGRLRHHPIELYLLRSPEPSEPAFRRKSLVDSALEQRGCLRDYFAELERPHPHIEFERIVPFAGDDDCYTYFFHPPEITDSQRRECRIYCHTWQEGDIAPMADSFSEWLSQADRSFSESDDEFQHAVYPKVFKQLTNRTDFIPYWADTDDSIPKVPPAESDVALWLAWNNHTARDLARSIREHGRTDAPTPSRFWPTHFKRLVVPTTIC